MNRLSEKFNNMNNVRHRWQPSITRGGPHYNTSVVEWRLVSLGLMNPPTPDYDDTSTIDYVTQPGDDQEPPSPPPVPDTDYQTTIFNWLADPREPEDEENIGRAA